MTDPRESRFCELLESPELSDEDWEELERLGRELDLLDELEACVTEALSAEIGGLVALH